MIFRAPLTRATRGLLCAGLAVVVGWAIHGVITFEGLYAWTRAVALTFTITLELALVAGLWRLWVVCLIVDDTGATVRNFRGDIRLRRGEIRGVFAAMDFAGCHVGIRLKTGDEIHLDGIAYVTPDRTNRTVQEISDALGLTPLEPKTR